MPARSPLPARSGGKPTWIRCATWVSSAGHRSRTRMRNMGLIRGASLENAVCFTPSGVMNPGGLRAPDECCRHKALDLIGDLALLGRPLLGHVIAERAGHAMHAALVARIMSDPSLYEIITFDQLASRVAHALVSQ